MYFKNTSSIKYKRFLCHCYIFNSAKHGNLISCLLLDINECNVDNACHYNATCNNIPGSFECNCLSGYRGDGSNCTDVDECTENIDNCHMRASCTNTYGGFSCSCEEGYIGNGTYCESEHKSTLYL